MIGGVKRPASDATDAKVKSIKLDKDSSTDKKFGKKGDRNTKTNKPST